MRGLAELERCRQRAEKGDALEMWEGFDSEVVENRTCKITKKNRKKHGDYNIQVVRDHLPSSQEKKKRVVRLRDIVPKQK